MSTPSSTKKLTRAEWDALRESLTRWYIAENQTVRQIKDLLAIQGHNVTPKMVKDRFASWKLRKHKWPDTPSPSASPGSKIASPSADSGVPSTFTAHIDRKRLLTDDGAVSKRARRECGPSADLITSTKSSLEVVSNPVRLTSQPLDCRSAIEHAYVQDVISHLTGPNQSIALPLAIPACERMERDTLCSIVNWCHEYRSSKSLRKDDSLTCKIYLLLDECKLAVGAACGFGVKTSWTTLSAVAERARGCWTVKRPESFLYTLYGLLRLGEDRQGRDQVANLVIKTLGILALEELGPRHPMTLLFQMASFRLLSHEFCRNMWQILETEHISHAKDSVRLLRARLLRAFGDVLINMGRYEDAEEMFYKALENADLATDASAVAGAYRGLARVKRYQRNPKAAQAFLERASSRLREAGKEGSSVGVKVLYESAYAYTLMGDLASSERRYREALQLYEQTDQDMITNRIIIVRSLHETLIRRGKLIESSELEGAHPQAFEMQ